MKPAVRLFLAALGVFLVALAYFALLMPWRTFLDPDAFYHAHVSLLLWQSGPLMAFPWLDLTTLGTAYADHHFLFHVLEAPLVVWQGWAMGSRFTGVLLSAALIATAYACLRWLGVKRPLVWTSLLAFTYPLDVRTLLGKATPLALLLFVLGLAAAWKRRPILVCAVAIVFALSHGGWVYLLGSIALLAMGQTAYLLVVEDAPWRDAIRSTLWREFLAACAGAAIGTVVHPNFPQNISFLWVQVVKIGLGTPYEHVTLGAEWLPTGPGALLASFAPWLIAFILGLAGLLLAPRKPLDRGLASATVAFAFPVAAFVAFTLKSRRNAEYLAPALALWIPWIWSMVDTHAFRHALMHGFSAWMRRIVTAALIVAFLATVGKGIWMAYEDLHTPRYVDDQWRAAMAPVMERAYPGDRVFHSDWDEFPLLWNMDDRLKYVAGLDPTFLYEASSTLSDAYRDVTWGRTSSTADQAWDLIHGRMAARFVFVDKRDHGPFLELLKGDSRYELLADTEDAATFEVLPERP